MIPGVRTISRQLHIENVNIYYEFHHPAASKAKKVFLLIHGFLSSTFSFRAIIPLLAQDFNVVSVDLPGFGKSEKSLRFRYSYENYARTLIQFIKKLSLSNIILVGHSMGGQIALHIAKQAPYLVNRCILIGSSAYLKKAKKKLIYGSYLPFIGRLLKKWFAKKDVKENLLTVVYDSTIIDDEMIQGYSEPFQDKRFLDCMIRLLRHREGDLSVEELQSIQTPCLLVWGTDDQVIPLEIGQRLVTDLPNAKLISYKKTGHLLCEEKPKQLYQDILRFLTE